MRKLLTFILFVSLPVLTVFAQQPDSVITEFLSASVITEGNITYKVDRTTHFFSSEEVKAAKDDGNSLRLSLTCSSTSRVTRWRLWPERRFSF